MEDLKPVLNWTVTQVAAVRQRLVVSTIQPSEETVIASFAAIEHLANIVEELARHIDLLEREQEPWLKPGDGK